MSLVPTFAVLPTFLGVNTQREDARVYIAGIPFDLGTSYRPGARFGPEAIRRASRMLIDGAHPVFWNEPAALPICDVGNFEVSHGDIPATLTAIERQAGEFRHLVSLGGDHSITLGLLRALARRHGPVGLIHFDAHVDTWPESFGQAYGHGSPFYHAIEEGLISPRHTVQIGIRSPVQKAIYDWTLGKGVTIIDAATIHLSGPAAAAQLAVAITGDGPVYLTFDVDALDPAFAPGTGTPEAGGLATWQAQAIIRGLKDVRFVGMDVVEVAPAYDPSEITALAAATMVWEYLSILGARGSFTEQQPLHPLT